MIGGLDQGGQFRTNLAFLAGPDGAQGDLSLHDGQGLPLATFALSLGPWQWQQKNLAAWFALSSNLQRVRVGLQLTAGTLDGYASRIDNGTGDAVVLPLTRVSTVPQLPGGSPTISGCSNFSTR